MGIMHKLIAVGREEADALWTQVNALIVDLAAGVARNDNVLRARNALTAIVADLTEIRTRLAAAVVDLGVVRTPVAALVTDLALTVQRLENSTVSYAAVANATTNGKLKTTNPADFRVAGAIYHKDATDNLWDLTGQSATDGTHYRAFWLYLDASGTASIAAGTDALTSAANALAALPAVDSTKSVIGVYVAGPSTNFANALAAQGTIYNGWPATQTLTAASPAALTATSPAALTTDTNRSIANGTTAGKFKSRSDVEYAITGVLYAKAATDDLWDLSALTTLTGAQYQAVYLYLDSSGTASIGAGTAAASSAADIAALPSIPSTKAVIGTFVAGLSTNFANALSSQGTLYDGLPASSVTLTATATTLISP